MVSLKDCAKIVIIFNMVALPLVFGAGEDDDKKQWSSVQKLIGSNNFILWYSGLSVALMGMTSHKWKNATSFRPMSLNLTQALRSLENLSPKSRTERATTIVVVRAS